MVRSPMNSGWSAATQVKAVSPRFGMSQGARGCFALQARIVVVGDGLKMRIQMQSKGKRTQLSAPGLKEAQRP